MYQGASQATFEKAKHLRNKQTAEEIILWEKLNKKQILNVRFRRQHPINIYIVDFYCHKAKLVLELDGKIHLKGKEYDKERTEIIESFGIRVIRFKNEDLLNDIDKIVDEIRYNVNQQLKNKRNI